MGQQTSITINSNNSQHAHHRDAYEDTPQHQQQQQYSHNMRDIETNSLLSSSPHQAYELPSLVSSNNDATRLTLTSASTIQSTHRIKYPGNIRRLVRSTVIQTIQDELLSASTMTFTRQAIEQRREIEMGYKRHQTQQPSGLSQDNYIRATLAYMKLKDLAHSLSAPIVKRYPGCSFPQLPQHIKTQLVSHLNQQAAIHHRLLIEKSEKNWLALYFLNSYFRSYKWEHMKRQKKGMATTSK